ncbi:MAG: ferrochelatase [Gemmatimonadota bacterium]|jgi:ferrochelatase|nr:ferrochelatase [Gemmatimonadota bacterium]
MKIGVLLLNFGEPENPTYEEVVPFLERIFALNSPLMGQGEVSDAEVWARSRRMAEERAPGLMHEYEIIGGSPLHAQAREQAEALQAELARRGHDSVVLLGMQFTDPPVESAVEAARAAGVDFLVPFPVYPICGPSTTVAALNQVDAWFKANPWDVARRDISGWHRHPLYVKTRADAIRAVVESSGLDLSDPDTRLVFSAHGTPVKYLQDGSRYEEYTREFCDAVAVELGSPAYQIGFQNHTNRPGVQWTQPDIEAVIDSVDARRVIVDPVSFMHEQSETLAELDDDLRERAEERGLEYFRVPIPYLASDFVTMMADLVLSAVSPEAEGSVQLHQCRCKPTKGTVCLNGLG